MPTPKTVMTPKSPNLRTIDSCRAMDSHFAKSIVHCERKQTRMFFAFAMPTVCSLNPANLIRLKICCS